MVRKGYAPASFPLRTIFSLSVMPADFRGQQIVSMCVANLANVTIINIDPHTDGFVDDLFLMHLNAFNKLVSDLHRGMP